MSNNLGSHLQDAAIFTRVVEIIFRKMIRFLVGRISLVKLQEMIRVIYVQESKQSLVLSSPNKNISLSKLAVLTGLDTRTLTKVMSGEQFRKPIHEEQGFLKSMTPESCILDLWLSDPRFTDAETGLPKMLELSNSECSFEQIVAEVVTSRGVTAQSLLDKLILNKSVRFIEGTQKIMLLEEIDAPFKAGDAIRVLEIGLVGVASLLDTVFHNYKSVKAGGSTYYQRGCWTHRLNPENFVEFEKKMRIFLRRVDVEARELISAFEEPNTTENQITSGVSMFFIEDRLNQTEILNSG